MPRTKVSKSSKRNREEAVKEEKIRQYNTCLEMALKNIDDTAAAYISEIDMAIDAIISRTSDTVLDKPFINIFKHAINNFTDYENVMKNAQSHPTGSQSNKLGSGNDDGYITEESGSSASSSALKAYLSMTQRGRTPGPFRSAQARRQRRSRSACADNVKPIEPSKNNSRNAQPSERHSRNKLRTPMAVRPKAFSADRGVVKLNNENSQKNSPACAFLRWPKPGEFVVSIHGTPVLAQGMPDRFANVNIPIKDGVLSLRPKKLEEIESNIVEKVDDETLHQIKTLHKNLDMLVSLASKNLFKENK